MSDRVVWFHCFSGIAGDMALGSLLDAGADLNEVRKLLAALPVTGWTLEARPVLRAGLAATHVVVKSSEDLHSRTYSTIAGMCEKAQWPERLRTRALSVFEALAIAEGKVHRQDPSEVHFHEVGSLDAIVDVVGTCAALEVLDVDVVTASPIALGHGIVKSEHGNFPNPAPAVVALLEGIPVEGRDINYELTTPTGAAILAALSTSFGPQPSMIPIRWGFGAGSRDTEAMPNVTQVVIGTALSPGTALSAGVPSGLDPGEPMTLLETNIDDLTGEVLAHTVGKLMDCGVNDAWLTPVTMKKGRPAQTLHVLCESAMAAVVRKIIIEETGTLGIRGQTIRRWASERSMASVEIGGERVRIKVGPTRAKAEYEDAAVVAKKLELPLREVTRMAEQKWQQQQQQNQQGQQGRLDGRQSD